MQSALWRRRRDPALWLSLSVAAPYLGMLAYFVSKIAQTLGII